jgi:hypothetical protein
MEKGTMAKDDTVGYADQEQKDAQLEALKTEYAGLKQSGDEDRAKQVAAYAKEYHGATLSTRSTAAAKDD